MDPATLLYDALMVVSQTTKSSMVSLSAIQSHIGQKASIARLLKDGRIIAVWPDGTIVLRPPFIDQTKPPIHVEALIRKFLHHTNTIPEK
jgi:hypothetical protein